MKIKVFLATIVVLICVGMLGCGFANSGESHLEKELRTDKEKAEALFKVVTEALEAKDKESLKEVFSTYAINNTPGLDEQIDELMEFYPGCDGGYTVNISTYEKSAYAGKQYIMYPMYIVKHNDEEYRMRFTVYVENVKEPEKIGLHIIEVLTEGTVPDGFRWKKEDSKPGIYVWK